MKDEKPLNCLFPRNLCIWLAAFTLICTPPVFASALDDVSVEILEEANKYILKGDFLSAVIQLKNAARKNPNNGDIRFKLALIYLTLEQAVNAEKELRTALKLGVNPAVIQFPLARTFLLRQEFNKILSETSLNVVQASEKAQLLSAHSYAHSANKNPEEGERLALKAMKLAPNYPLATDALAAALMEQGQLDEAERELDKYIAAANAPSERLWYRKGELRRIARDSDGAVAAYSTGLEHFPDYLQLRAARAIQYINRSQNEEATGDIDVILASSPNNIVGKYLKSLQLWRLREFEEADDVLSSLGDRISQYSPAIILMANVKMSLEDFETAKSYADQYLALDPESARGLTALGQVELGMQQVEKAITALEKAERLAPDNFGVVMLLGSAYFQNQQFDKATAMFERGQEMNPENTSLRTQAAISQLGLGNEDVAIGELQKLLDKGENLDRVGFILISTYIRDKKFDEAIVVSDKMAEKLSDNPLPKFFKANIMRDQGKSEAAKAGYRKVTEEFPDYTPAKLSLAGLEIEEGNVDEAEVSLKEILAKDETNFPAHIGLAKTAEIRGNDKLAETHLLRAIELQPDRIQLQHGLVRLLLRSNRLQDAHDYATKMVSQFPDVPLSLLVIAETSMALEDYDNAKEYVRRVVRLLPDSGVARYQQARVFRASGDIDMAKSALNEALLVQPDYEPARELLSRLIAQTEGVDAAMKVAQPAGTSESDEQSIKKARLLIEAKQYDEALKIFSDMLDEKPTAYIVGQYYITLVLSKDNDTALKWLTEWVNMHPKDDVVITLLAHELLAGAQLVEAAAQYEKLIALVPDNPIPWNNLGWIYNEIGDNRAQKTAKTAYELSPNSPIIADTYGWILVKEGQFDESVRILKRAHATVPDNKEISYHYAVALKSTGDADAAKMLLEQAVKSKQNFVGRDAAVKLLETMN